MPIDTRLQCNDCGGVMWRSWDELMAIPGWPKCCDRTMRLDGPPRGRTIEQCAAELFGRVASPAATVLEAAA